MKEQRYLYVVFSSTPYKMGRFLRIMTRGTYNHVSVSLDPELRELYSFARHYRNTPFYGGFVRETPVRYHCRNRVATVKVCAVPLTEEQYREIGSLLQAMYEESEKYIYNLISAICALVHLRVRLPNAYTCVEFAVELLSKFGLCQGIRSDRFYTIKRLLGMLEPYASYTGTFPQEVSVPDPFEHKQSLKKAAAQTFASNARLVSLLFSK